MVNPPPIRSNHLWASLLGRGVMVGALLATAGTALTVAAPPASATQIFCLNRHGVFVLCKPNPPIPTTTTTTVPPSTTTTSTVPSTTTTTAKPPPTTVASTTTQPARGAPPTKGSHRGPGVAHLHSAGISAGGAGLAVMVVFELVGGLGIVAVVVRRRRRLAPPPVSG